MIDLLSRFDEVKNPETRAKNHKKRYGIEYFSKMDVEYAVAEIKRAAEKFFEGTEMNLFEKQFNKLKTVLEQGDAEEMKKIMRKSSERRRKFDKE